MTREHETYSRQFLAKEFCFCRSEMLTSHLRAHLTHMPGNPLVKKYAQSDVTKKYMQRDQLGHIFSFAGIRDDLSWDQG